MTHRIVHTPEHPLPYLARPTFAPEASLPVVDPSTVPTAILPRPNPVDAGVAALTALAAAMDRADRVISTLTREQFDAAAAHVDTPEMVWRIIEHAAVIEQTHMVEIARKHLARFAPSSYAHPAIAALVAELEAL